MKVGNLSVIFVSMLAVTSLSSYAATTLTTAAAESTSTALLVADAHEVWTSGKVVRVSAARGKVTIEHEAIKNLEMMAMTMPFTAEDKALLDELKKGDMIEFVAAMEGDELILKKIRKPKS